MQRNAFLKLNFSLFTITPVISPNAKLMMQIIRTDIRMLWIGWKYARIAARLTAIKLLEVLI